MDLSKATLADTQTKKFKLAILPWGAIEPHNLHLPYITDCILSQEIALEAVDKSGMDVAVLPPVFMGQQNPGQYDYPLCIHTRTQTQKMIIEDIVLSLRKQGVMQMLIVNGHGGNTFKGIIRDLAFSYPEFTIYSTEWYTIVPKSGYFEEAGEHADELETSVMLHYHPELVLMDRAGVGASRCFEKESLNEKIAWIPRNWKAVTDDTGIGNPLKSTAEKGARYAEAVTDKLAKLIRDICC